MGLIRKTAMVGSLGLVSGNSKKQRLAKAQLGELKKLNAANGIAPSGMMRGTHYGDNRARRIAKQARLQQPVRLPVQQPVQQPMMPVVQQPMALQAPTPAAPMAPLPSGLMMSPDGQHVLIENEWRPFARNHVGAFWFNGEGWVTL
ncbi:hypothetical protein [Nocardioides pelophilus]|uniref:hypothetical protein n=1 Tax=Nocardioides pelophilus TaxID=2172019 RepID=UPI001C7E9947|nr:hypothetical protein [Nocardioides pelophilus]